jgi:phosphoribosylaminoimidazole-succinocarboxamide synthase
MNLSHLGSGKVREMYAVGDDQILIVASDRISAFDVVLPTPIPDKGAVLTALSIWWFEQLSDLLDNHLLSVRIKDFPAQVLPYADDLRGRAMLCRRLEMLPVECVVRSYLTGSGLKDYKATGQVSGHTLPPGLVDGSKLPEMIYTPSTKAPQGEHDENISQHEAAARIGAERAAELERLSLSIFERATSLAAERGILIADTKFEFGVDSHGAIRLADEVLTPDSSRFWPADQWQPGQPQPSFDKQYVRDWLVREGLAGEPAELPDDVVTATRERYVEAYERITGQSFDAYLADRAND